MNQRLIHLDTQKYHKNTKLETMIYMQRTCKVCMGKSILELSIPRSLILCILSGCGLCICPRLLQEEAFLMTAE